MESLLVDQEDVVMRMVSWFEIGEVEALRLCSSRCFEAVGRESVWREIVVMKFWGGDVESMKKCSPFDGKPCCPLNQGESNVKDAYVMSCPCSRLGFATSWRGAAARWCALSRRLEKDRWCSAKIWVQVATAWFLLEQKLKEQDSEASRGMLASLRPPATKESLLRIEPRSLRYAYAVHDGQSLAFDEARDRRSSDGIRRAQKSIFHGIFGGFSAYDYVVASRFAPSSAALATRTPSEGGNNVTFAWSFRKDRRFVVNDADDRVEVYDVCGGGNDFQGPEFAAPRNASFGDWFFEYASRVSSNYYSFGLVVPDDAETESIILFKNLVDGRDCSETVTQGVECRASALYLPVHPHGFVYSIRLNLAKDAPMDHCQLLTRRWIIFDHDAKDGQKIKQVSGEGVVGKFPRLNRGGGWRDDFQVGADVQRLGFARAVRLGVERSGPFIYQSFSGPMANPDADNTFEGQMGFYPNEFLKPTGPPFQVIVPPFLLKRPPFIF